MERVRASWLIVLGPTGLGKTREVAELAKTHSEEGWTILRLNNQDLLTVPDGFPADRLNRQPKLLFVLDNLNQALYLGQRLPRVDAEDKKAEPIKSPLQNRLLETLNFYINACPGQVRVVATARNERDLQPGEEVSQWERLGIEKYPKFWRRFERYELLPPEDVAVANVLVETAHRASIGLEQTDLAQMVRTSDRTFRNLVENLTGAKNRKEVLTTETFAPTMSGTWEERYQNAQRQYGTSAALIYNAIDLLRQTEVVLHPLTVMSATKLLSEAEQWRWWIWQRRQIHATLTGLMQSERILEPRDGQIEAKGSVVEAGDYLSSLAQSLPSQLSPQAVGLSLWGLAQAAYEWRQYKLILDILHTLEQRQRSEFFARQFTLKGVALSALNRKSEAIVAYDIALSLQPEDHAALYNKGVALAAIGRTEEAIAAYDAALDIKPDYHKAIAAKSFALFQREQYEETIISLDLISAIQPDYLPLEISILRGTALIQLRQFDDAMCAIEAVSKLYPDNFSLLTLKNVALHGTGRYEEAIAASDAALRISPDDANTHYNKACSHALSTQEEEAIASLKKTIELDATDECIEQAKTDTDFDGIRDRPQFQALLTSEISKEP